MESYDASEDARQRDAAVTDDAALIAYESKWRRRLERLLRVHPARWRLSGLSDEEVIDELMLRLVDAIRTKPEERAAEREGMEWGLLFLARERRSMRRRFRLNVVLADPEGGLDTGRAPPTSEETLLEEEATSLLARARENAERGLSRPQRRWLSAMRMSANAGAFFEASGKPNLAAASRLLEKNRSSAARAFDELQERFIQERKKLED
jgi:hypothetical protein